jgi:hypothetical protein
VKVRTFPLPSPHLNSQPPLRLVSALGFREQIQGLYEAFFTVIPEQQWPAYAVSELADVLALIYAVVPAHILQVAYARLQETSPNFDGEVANIARASGERRWGSNARTFTELLEDGVSSWNDEDIRQVLVYLSMQRLMPTPTVLTELLMKVEGERLHVHLQKIVEHIFMFEINHLFRRN